MKNQSGFWRSCVCAATLAFLVIPKAFAATDLAVSAVAGCSASLGGVIESGNGLRANGGTAVLRCPLRKLSGAGVEHTIYARVHRAQSSSADPFCYLISTAPYGSNTELSYGYASSQAGVQSIEVPTPGLYLTGYLDLYCLLNADDTLYGVRHVQVE